MIFLGEKSRRLFRLAALPFMFLCISGIGWLREQYDAMVIDKRYRSAEADLQFKIDQVGEGIPLDDFRRLLSEAYDRRNGEWVVSLPVSYDENCASTNVELEQRYFTVVGDIVKPNDSKKGFAMSHEDQFESSVIWYYFRRAWYSSAKSEDAFPPGFGR